MRDAARRSALGATGVGLVLVGVGFLLSAAWILLAQALDALLASAIIGATLTGIGLILLGVATRSDPAPRPATAPEGSETDYALLRRLLRDAGLEVPPKGEAPPLTDAFVFGLVLALRLRRPRDTAASARDDGHGPEAPGPR